MELAWRVGAKLDWIWQLHDLQGRPRDWAVLYGLALNQVGSNVFTRSFLILIDPTDDTGREAFAPGGSSRSP